MRETKNVEKLEKSSPILRMTLLSVFLVSFFS